MFAKFLDRSSLFARLCTCCIVIMLAPTSGADVYNYEGLVVTSDPAFFFLGVTPGSGLVGTLDMTPPPGGGTITYSN
ncbi:MAG: hypothetical protein HKN70_12090, partial [Gammaproteobacteria bacterium]|nr:hypothetical protein [Gammaproteobacteria bacterium]